MRQGVAEAESQKNRGFSGPSGNLYRAHPISQGSAMDKICPYCQSQHLIKNGSAYGVPTRRAAPAKWKCKDCLRQTSFKPPRGEPLWKKETAVLLYTLGLSMNAIAKQLGVSTPSILNWIRAHARHVARPQPEPGESVVYPFTSPRTHTTALKLR